MAGFLIQQHCITRHSSHFPPLQLRTNQDYPAELLRSLLFSISARGRDTVALIADLCIPFLKLRGHAFQYDQKEAKKTKPKYSINNFLKNTDIPSVLFFETFGKGKMRATPVLHLHISSSGHSRINLSTEGLPTVLCIFSGWGTSFRSFIWIWMLLLTVDWYALIFEDYHQWSAKRKNKRKMKTIRHSFYPYILRHP